MKRPIDEMSGTEETQGSFPEGPTYLELLRWIVMMPEGDMAKVVVIDDNKMAFRDSLKMSRLTEDEVQMDVPLEEGHPIIRLP